MTAKNPPNYVVDESKKSCSEAIIKYQADAYKKTILKKLLEVKKDQKNDTNVA